MSATLTGAKKEPSSCGPTPKQPGDMRNLSHGTCKHRSNDATFAAAKLAGTKGKHGLCAVHVCNQMKRLKLNGSTNSSEDEAMLGEITLVLHNDKEKQP